MITGSGNVLGGTEAADRNLISANGVMGVFLVGPETSENRIEGNFIGTDRLGTSVLNAQRDGGIVLWMLEYNTIGGSAAGAGNLISGNHAHGVALIDAVFNWLGGNFIGTQPDCVSPLGNLSTVSTWSPVPTTNSVGGTESGEGNTIAFNGGNGVTVGFGPEDTASVHNAIRGNFHLANGELGIDGRQRKHGERRQGFRFGDQFRMSLSWVRRSPSRAARPSVACSTVRPVRHSSWISDWNPSVPRRGRSTWVRFGERRTRSVLRASRRPSPRRFPRPKRYGNLPQKPPVTPLNSRQPSRSSRELRR